MISTQDSHAFVGQRDAAGVVDATRRRAGIIVLDETQRLAENAALGVDFIDRDFSAHLDRLPAEGRRTGGRRRISNTGLLLRVSGGREKSQNCSHSEGATHHRL